MINLIFLIGGVVSFHVEANELFAQADVNAGKALVEKHCISCHASSYGGDGSEIYTRAFPKVVSKAGLVAQVRACNTHLGLKWFEEDELNASAYLNQQYYHFE
jgi:cytochrome c553